MTITQEKLEDLSRGILLPIVLVLDAWVFQYLVFVYWLRRREFRVKMLFVASFLAFIAHIYSHETYETLWEFNDISETCLQLTFTIQITIIGRDVSKKVKLRSIVHFTHAAEVLILASWIDVLGTALEVAGVNLGTRMHELENWVESLSLAFVLRRALLSLRATTASCLRPSNLDPHRELAEDDGNDMFVYKVPFITGTMVITIDKNSLSRVSDSTPTDPSKVYDFGQLEKKTKSGSGSKERGLFDFVATHFVQYKLTQKAVSWVKGIF
ncbi:hypothetical protein PHYSODRAFT_252987 [Phytophthora sojae]|uniref:Uncharacterized protein n=1 Tax=Phytophthora sojae (strain P6497) TaxID=1094619 RepID=G4ZKT5_PHYSP|nr:hypothetical protein PHYSODRAFT_252987 [Phytophthora sojae]EGZ14531.1 hypothetical protein PHYSODRAFT_252987 [Phytophthora sojae]|eukprot:XP_009528280.1 hypothetical protein PHYSODRAFT_252987 [Phytophthora sojae]